MYEVKAAPESSPYTVHCEAKAVYYSCLQNVLLAHLESAYSLNEGCRNFGKTLGCFMIIRW